jgi:hypothetical protein
MDAIDMVAMDLCGGTAAKWARGKDRPKSEPELTPQKFALAVRFYFEDWAETARLPGCQVLLWQHCCKPGYKVSEPHLPRFRSPGYESVGPVLSGSLLRPLEFQRSPGIEMVRGFAADAARYITDAREAVIRVTKADKLTAYIAEGCPVGTVAVDDLSTGVRKPLGFFVATVEIHFAVVADGWQWRGEMNPSLKALGARRNWKREGVR